MQRFLDLDEKLPDSLDKQNFGGTYRGMAAALRAELAERFEAPSHEPASQLGPTLNRQSARDSFYGESFACAPASR